MPLWAWLYLSLFFLLGVSGVIDDLSRESKLYFVTGSVLSTIFGVLFIVSYYYPTIKDIILPLVLPMLICGSIFEIHSVSRDLKEYHSVLTENQNLVIMFLVNLITIPAYVYGFFLINSGISV